MHCSSIYIFFSKSTNYKDQNNYKITTNYIYKMLRNRKPLNLSRSP